MDTFKDMIILMYTVQIIHMHANTHSQEVWVALKELLAVLIEWNSQWRRIHGHI